MIPTLRLTVTDYVGPTRWRWELSDSQGRFLADHEVQLDPTSRTYRGFKAPEEYLDYHAPITSPREQLDELGRWIGELVFGDVRDALWEHRASPALAVHLAVPPAADDLLLRPFELARFADGQLLQEAGVRFVYQVADGRPAGQKAPVGETLRMLAAFSLPFGANPLNLRRERYDLQRLVRRLTQIGGLAIELRILQYGTTRGILRDALEEAEGWDVIHLSGHGERGVLLLEDERGRPDPIEAEDLGGLLEPARFRLRLLILDACYSGAGSHATARAQVGLQPASQGEEGVEDDTLCERGPTALPSLARALAERLDCAALAMRYPVDDTFATDLMLSLHEKLLDKRRALPGALHLALDEALEADIPRPPLCAATPILVGARAAELSLAPPTRPAQPIALPTTGLSIAFPPEPERFVGRLRPMLRASQALAPRSESRGVLFYGMPGGGKTTCALELAYRHAERRFQGYVWYRAPEAGSDVSRELYNVLFEIERQLNVPDLGLTAALDQPERFRRFTLPQLRALLQQYSLLLVLDNLETLLTASNRWRDPLWGDLMAALLGHEGPSRVVLTARRRPAGLEDHPRLQEEAIHALSFAESVVLARELPHLQRLFDDEEGRALLRETLRVVQGHPKLLELADGLAADRGALAERVATAADEMDERADVLDAFLATDVPRAGETRQAEGDFVRALDGWTERVSRELSPTDNLVLTFLSRIEPDDRWHNIVELNWRDLLRRLADHHAAMAARAQPDWGLPHAVATLTAVGLVKAEREPLDPPEATYYEIHPGVAEAVRDASEPAVLDAVDIELGNLHIAWFERGLEEEMQGAGGVVAESARRAVPYLVRQKRWEELRVLLDSMLTRDSSPASVAFALTPLRLAAEAAAGTEMEVPTAGVLARTLLMAGRPAEGKQMLQDLLDGAIVRGDYALASSAANYIVTLLLSEGQLDEALAMAEEMAGYTRRADLGPWTQLFDEVLRLTVLNARGQYEEVLDAVEELWSRAEALPLVSEADETIEPWIVRETLLDTGHTAALQTERWETALTLNAGIVNAMEARGAGILELARAHVYDYGPLLSLGRVDEARELLSQCRAIFGEERDLTNLGVVYSALADLEDQTGGDAAAVGFQTLALRYSYQASALEGCALGHGKLADYLESSGAEPSIVLAHRLAAATILMQTHFGQLGTMIGLLAAADLPPNPPLFADVADAVERIEGVRFRALCERLPRSVPSTGSGQVPSAGSGQVPSAGSTRVSPAGSGRAPATGLAQAFDGDTVLAQIWELVAEERRRMEGYERRYQEVLASMPPGVQQAFELEGPAFSEALNAALAELPEPEGQSVWDRLLEEELIRPQDMPEFARTLQDWEPLLQRVAAATVDEELRQEIEPDLVDLEKQGWMLRDPVHRIWTGERDLDALSEGLDEDDTGLVERILEFVEVAERQERVLAQMPPAIRGAYDLEGGEADEALNAALAELPEDEADAIVERLVAVGLMLKPDIGQMLRGFEPLLHGVAAATVDEARRPGLEPELKDLEDQGWMLRERVKRIWAGERDAEALTEGLDAQDTALVQRALELVELAERQERVLAEMPSPIREAYGLEGQELDVALNEALAALPEEEAEAILERLDRAGLIQSPDVREMLNTFETLLQRIVDAIGDLERQEGLEVELTTLEEGGWMLQEPVHRIWAGERDAEALTEGLDEQDTALIGRILDILAV